MNMSRYVVRRILAVSAAILLAGLVLALMRAQFDVAREERGAAEEAQLFEYLYALENGPANEVDTNLAALRRINASHQFRHFRFALSDDSGTMLVAQTPDERATFLQRAFAWFAPGERAASAPWLLQRDDGRRFFASVALDPRSEQQEALDNLSGMLLVVGVLAGAIVLAVYVTLAHALAPMRLILATIDRYQRDDLRARVPALAFAESDAVGRALNAMADALETSQEQRRTLSLKLVSSQEDERVRIARELHDEFGQSLTAMRADLAWLARRVQAPEVREVLQGVSAQCETLQQTIRRLLARLRPFESREGGFAAALESLLAQLVRSWNDKLSQTTHLSLEFATAAAQIPDEVALTIYRLTQEALTNCVRHAQASRVQVRVEREGESALRWSVSDDGIGIGGATANLAAGNGLAGMRERVWALGGDFEIAQAAPRGLVLRANFSADVLRRSGAKQDRIPGEFPELSASTAAADADGSR
jgi:two-component system, NarL family, sensor histidine kinase UhpB